MRHTLPTSTEAERLRFLSNRKGNTLLAIEKLRNYLEWRNRHCGSDNSDFNSLTDTWTYATRQAGQQLSAPRVCDRASVHTVHARTWQSIISNTYQHELIQHWPVLPYTHYPWLISWTHSWSKNHQENCFGYWRPLRNRLGQYQGNPLITIHPVHCHAIEIRTMCYFFHTQGGKYDLEGCITIHGERYCR